MTEDPKSRRNGRRPEIEVREMDIDDLPVVFHMGDRTFTSATPNLYRTWDEYEVTSLFTTESEYCLVAEDKTASKVVGFAMGTTVTKPRSPWKYGYLVWMVVDDSYRQLGIGERLVRRLAERMVEAGVRILLVDTDAKNKAALAFFRNQGFEQPHPHVYLSMNLDELRKRRRKKGS